MLTHLRKTLATVGRRVRGPALAAATALSAAACEEPVRLLPAPSYEPGAADLQKVEAEREAEVAEASAPRVVEPPRVAEPPAAPAPPPAPPPDPEAEARAREDAARAAFEREYPWHGVAYHFLAQVRERPDGSSPVVGYMRRGAQFRAQPPLRGPGCPRGWARVPGDGFVCRGNGFDLGDEPQSFPGSPVGPARDRALPYAYAWVTRDDVPQYWRLPSAQEEADVRAFIARRRTEESRVEAAPAPATVTDEDTEDTEDTDESAGGPEPDLEAPPGLTADEAGGAPPPPPRPPAGRDAGVAETDPEASPAVLRMRMRRGYYVSIDRLETDGNRRFYRTVRGAYVPADAVSEAAPTTMRGVVLGGRWSLPLGFVYRGGVRSLRRESARGTLRLADPVDRLTPLPLESEVVTRGQRRYRISDRGQIVREDALRLAREIARPASIPEDARWVHVDRAAQVLVAYEGDRPVFATLVSTGRAGYETPVGTFRIQSKHVSTTMDDTNAGEESYSIEDVPWTMYFKDSYALHAAFWHDRFGRVRSHGCVNLAPADARWIFEWSEPMVQDGWHGRIADRRHAGAWVHVTE